MEKAVTAQGDVYKGTYICECINTFESSIYASLKI